MAAIATYLDYNASAPVRPGVEEAVCRGLTTHGNPSSVHRAGRVARRLLEDARDDILSVVKRPDMRLVFTSGGTEANNLAIGGAWQLGVKHLLLSKIEHPSVMEPAAKSDLKVTFVRTRKNGQLDLADLSDKLDQTQEKTLVSLMTANNETGVVQPVSEASDICREKGALLHTDAVQSFAKAGAEGSLDKADLVSVSAHKIGGPLGIGALLFRSDLHLAPTLSGGGQELGYRSGTENLGGALGFAEAARQSNDDQELWRRLSDFQRKLEEGLREISANVVIFGEEAPRLPTTVCFAEAGMQSETAVMALDLAGVAVSAGSACSSGKVSKSHVISAMGWNDDFAAASIRVSFGWATTEADIDRFLSAWREVRGRLLTTGSNRQKKTELTAGGSV